MRRRKSYIRIFERTSQTVPFSQENLSEISHSSGADLGGGVDRVASHPLHDWATKVM